VGPEIRLAIQELDGQKRHLGAAAPWTLVLSPPSRRTRVGTHSATTQNDTREGTPPTSTNPAARAMPMDAIKLTQSLRLGGGEPQTSASADRGAVATAAGIGLSAGEGTSLAQPRRSSRGTIESVEMSLRRALGSGPRGMAARKIFLVEDDEGLRTLEEKILSGLPEVVVQAFERAETALDGLERTRPSLLISDLGLPGMSGVELIARARSACPRIPVLVTTGSQPLFDRHLRRLSFIEIWEKPFSLQDLRDRVHDVLVAEAAAEPAAGPQTAPAPFTPFSVIDYLQMASIGQRDLVLQVRLGDYLAGYVEILGGEIWSCRLGELRNLEALQVILEHPDARVHFQPLTRTPTKREMTSSTPAILLELAAAHDDGRLTTPDLGRKPRPWRPPAS